MSTEKALEYLGLAMRELQAPAPILVRPGDNLPSLLEQAATGAVLQLDPAFVLEADLVVRNPVSLVSWLPRVQSARATVDTAGAILRGAHTVTAPDVSFVGLRLEGKNKDATILTAGPRTIVDGCVVLGSPTGQHRGIRADADGIQILRSYIGNIWKDQDTQAIAAWDGCKNLLIDDCFLEASGENVLFGGADSMTEAGIPQDILIQHCTLSKPLSWIGKAGLTAKNGSECAA